MNLNGNGRLRLVPPGGKYVTPFYFSAYYGGESSNMLFSPHSSSPSGHFEGGGLGNSIDPNDPILQDCKLLLTVSETLTNESIITAQEAPLGRKVQLPNGQYRVTAQLLSFGGHVFASAEARYHIVDAYEIKTDGSYRYTGEGTSNSALFDTLLNVQRNGGLPTGRAMPTSSSGAANLLPPQTPVHHSSGGGATRQASGSNRAPHPAAGGGSVRSQSGATLSEQVAATVRQSEDVLQHAVSHFGAAAAETAGRISRQSSMDSRGGGGGGLSSNPSSPHQRPPPMLRSKGGTPLYDGQQTTATHGGGHQQQMADPTSSGGEEGEDSFDTAGATSSSNSSRFVVPPAALLYSGAQLLLVLRPTTAQHAPVVNVLLQEEQRRSYSHRRGGHSDVDETSAPTLVTLGSQRVKNIAVPARGVLLHWTQRAAQAAHQATAAPTATLAAINRGSGIQLQLPSLLEVRAGAPRPSQTYSAVIVSEETFGPTGPDGVLGGVQFCIGPPTHSPLIWPRSATHAPSSSHPQQLPSPGDLRILLSIRPQKATQYAGCMPYMELQWLPPQSQASSYQYSQQGQQQQRGGGILEEHRQYNGNNRDAAPVAFRLLWKVSGGGGGTGGDQQDEIAFDANITSHDVIALHFSSRDDGSDARSSAAQQGSHRASQSTPLFALLSMNYRPVCRVPISPEAAREFASSRPLFLNVIAHLRTAATAGATTTTTTTSTVIDILRGVTALSHYTMVADVLCVPGEDLQRNDHHNAGEGGGLGGGVVQRRALYVWNNGESMLEASRHDLAIVS